MPLLDEFRDSCAAGIAFDHMTVSPRRLPSALVSAMSGQLESEFAEEIGLMEARRSKLLIKDDSVSVDSAETGTGAVSSCKRQKVEETAA